MGKPPSNRELGGSARAPAELDGRGRLATGGGDARGALHREGAGSSPPLLRALGSAGPTRKLWGSWAPGRRR